jgi:hypothetical protein
MENSHHSSQAPLWQLEHTGPAADSLDAGHEVPQATRFPRRTRWVQIRDDDGSAVMALLWAQVGRDLHAFPLWYQIVRGGEDRDRDQ